MTSMWIVTIVVSLGIAALTIRTISVTAQRDYYKREYSVVERQCLEAWAREENQDYEIIALRDENQYLQETIAFWVEERMTGSKWDNNRYTPVDDYGYSEEVPF